MLNKLLLRCQLIRKHRVLRKGCEGRVHLSLFWPDLSFWDLAEFSLFWRELLQSWWQPWYGCNMNLRQSPLSLKSFRSIYWLNPGIITRSIQRWVHWIRWTLTQYMELKVSGVLRRCRFCSRTKATVYVPRLVSTPFHSHPWCWEGFWGGASTLLWCTSYQLIDLDCEKSRDTDMQRTSKLPMSSWSRWICRGAANAARCKLVCTISSVNSKGPLYCSLWSGRSRSWRTLELCVTSWRHPILLW